MHRRSFLQGATLLGITPFVMSALDLSAEAQPDALPLSAEPSSADTKHDDSVLFVIDGWDQFTPEDRSRNAVSITMNHLWRTAWR